MYILIAPMADMTTMFYWALKYVTLYYLDFDIQLTFPIIMSIKVNMFTYFSLEYLTSYMRFCQI